MSAYENLAFSYDRLTNDVSYRSQVQYIEKLIRIHHRKPVTVLDLACGTGSLMRLLAQKGYDVMGLDASEEMLTVAAEKFADETDIMPILIHSKMQTFRLPKPVDLIVSGLDSMNYLTKPADLQKTFLSVYNALNSGGLLIFDMNTPAKFRALDGQVFLDEDDNVYCVWRASFSEKKHIMTYGMDLFQRQGEKWKRSFEEHREYAYEVDDVKSYLIHAGFSGISVYGDRTIEIPGENEQRVYFCACKE